MALETSCCQGRINHSLGRHIVLQYICEWTIYALKMVRESMTKRLLCSVTVEKMSFFCDITFCLNMLTTIRSAVRGHPQLSLKCRLRNRISFDFLTGASAKLKRGHAKRYAVALSVWGASRSRLCSWPRVHFIRPKLLYNSIAFVVTR